MDGNTSAQDAQNKTKPLTPKIHELIAASQSVILATIDSDGKPTASYAPYVQVNNTFYILVSFMAKHTKNLLNGQASMMFIEDESATKQIYARERLTFDTVTSQVERDSDLWNSVLPQLKEKHGKILDILSEMQDFILVALKPTVGNYVNGFGSAYIVDENLEVVQHRNDVNHQTK